MALKRCTKCGLECESDEAVVERHFYRYYSDWQPHFIKEGFEPYRVSWGGFESICRACRNEIEAQADREAAQRQQEQNPSVEVTKQLPLF